MHRSNEGTLASHNTAHAVFGPQTWQNLKKARVVLANPSNGCMVHSIPGFMSDRGNDLVMLVERGACTFATKVLNAQYLGAAYVLRP